MEVPRHAAGGEARGDPVPVGDGHHRSAGRAPVAVVGLVAGRVHRPADDEARPALLCVAGDAGMARLHVRDPARAVGPGRPTRAGGRQRRAGPADRRPAEAEGRLHRSRSSRQACPRRPRPGRPRRRRRARRCSEAAASATSRPASAPPTSLRCSARGRRVTGPGGRQASRGTGGAAAGSRIVTAPAMRAQDVVRGTGQLGRTGATGAPAVRTGSTPGDPPFWLPPLLPPVAPEPAPPVMAPSQPPRASAREARHDASLRAVAAGPARCATTLSSVHLSASARAGEQTPTSDCAARRNPSRPRTVRDHRVTERGCRYGGASALRCFGPGLGSAGDRAAAEACSPRRIEFRSSRRPLRRRGRRSTTRPHGR